MRLFAVRDCIAAQPPEWIEIVQATATPLTPSLVTSTSVSQRHADGSNVVKVLDFGIAIQCAFDLVREVD